jgi:hypothetical protein
VKLFYCVSCGLMIAVEDVEDPTGLDCKLCKRASAFREITDLVVGASTAAEFRRIEEGDA